MLQEFRVSNFKSLINVVFKPQETNLLIGRNNSGKTNLCQALKFISYSSGHTLDECADTIARGRFHMTNFAFEKSTVDFHVRALFPYQGENLTFEYDLTISPPGDSVTETSVRLDREVLSVAGAGFDKVVLMENIAGRVRLLDEKKFRCGKRSYQETTAPVDATMLHRIFDSEANPRASLFKQNLAAFFYYDDLSPAAMRGSARKPREEFMAPNGSNLASVLYWLKTGNERKYRDLLTAIRKIEPELDLINFYPASEENVFMYFEDRAGHSLSVENASNGTLRFLALSYVLLIQPEVLQPVANLSPLCIIEEPENGVYVGFLKTLFEMRGELSGGHQLIFTSHSPYFIDLFDDHLDGVFVIDRRNGQTSITQPDAARVREWLERFPLGEQHFREMLG